MANESDILSPLPVLPAKATLVYAHGTDTAAVWLLVAGGRPQLLPMEQVVKLLEERNPVQARLVGSRANASLALFLDFLRPPVVSVQVATPSVFAGDDPEELLYSLSCWNGRPPSMGGWHELNENDRATLRLVIAGDEDRDRFLDAHPATKSLTFIPGLRREACASLLAEIGDPRWFEDPRKPGSLSRLHAFLGLGIPSARRPDLKRNHLAQACWYDPPPPKDWKDIPACFLWRRWYKNGRGAEGLRAASRMFAKYLSLTWLQVLYQGRYELFVPEIFFADEPHTAAAYRSFLENKDGS